MGGRSARTLATTRTCFALAAGNTPPTAASIKGGRKSGSRSISSFPVMMRETSRMSLINWAWSLALRPMTSIACRAPSGGSPPDCSISIQPRMACSGVRSSCDSVARNSSFTRLASSAAARRWSSGCVGIEHELADDAIQADQGDERHGGDPLGGNGGQVRGQ